MPGGFRPAILRQVRPLQLQRHRARWEVVFSSSGDPIRATGTKVTARDSSLMSILVSSASGVAESLFASLFPSDSRLCGAPLINVSRLSVYRECLGEQGESLEPPFAEAVAYGCYQGGLRKLRYLMKYEQLRSAAAVLGSMLAQAVIGTELLAASTAWS